MLFSFAVPSERFGNLYANTVTAISNLISLSLIILWKACGSCKAWMHFIMSLKTGPGELVLVTQPLQVPRHFQIQEEEEQAPFVGVKLDNESCWLTLCVCVDGGVESCVMSSLRVAHCWFLNQRLRYMSSENPFFHTHRYATLSQANLSNHCPNLNHHPSPFERNTGASQTLGSYRACRWWSCRVLSWGFDEAKGRG